VVAGGGFDIWRRTVNARLVARATAHREPRHAHIDGAATSMPLLLHAYGFRPGFVLGIRLHR
jgi:hypothetical protein